MGAHQKLMAAQRSARAESLPNYYAVLGVDKSASPAAIRTAFRYLASCLPCLTEHGLHLGAIIMVSSGVVATPGFAPERGSTVPTRALLMQ